MSIQMEYTGKDVTTAINAACASLNLTKEKLDIKVMSTGSTGIFGLGRKKAIVKVTIKEDSADIMEKSESPGAADKENQSLEASIEDTGDKKDELIQEEQAAVQDNDIKITPEEAAPQPENTSLAVNEVLEKPGQEETKAQETGDSSREVSEDICNQVKDDLSKMLELMDFPLQVSVSSEKGRVLANIEGESVAEIIGHHGQTLNGLQYLLRKIVSKKNAEQVLLSVDADGYREKRKLELEEEAVRLADEVKEIGKTRSIPPLNSAERRIVHMILKKDNTIRSRSVGDGLFKKILIYIPGKSKNRSSKKRRSNKNNNKVNAN
jgi:spoIIIJ-associated protein